MKTFAEKSRKQKVPVRILAGRAYDTPSGKIFIPAGSEGYLIGPVTGIIGENSTRLLIKYGASDIEIHAREGDYMQLKPEEHGNGG